MRKLLVIAAVIGLQACDDASKLEPPIENETVPVEANVIGRDQCGEPVYEGQQPRDYGGAACP